MYNVNFKFAESDFPIQVMRCKRVYCAVSRTRFSLQNNLRGVQRYVHNI